MEKPMNNDRIEAVLERQHRSLGLDKLVALAVAIGMLVCILGLRSASQTQLFVERAQPVQSANVAVAADLRGNLCAPDATHLC